MSTNNSDAKDDKMTETQTKNQIKPKTNSSKVDSNYRKFDSFDHKYNDRTFRSNKFNKPMDNSERHRSHRNYSNGTDYHRQRQYHNDYYVFNSDRVHRTNPSSDRNHRSEPKPSEVNQSNCRLSSNNYQSVERQRSGEQNYYQNPIRSRPDRSVYSYSGNFYRRRKHSPEVHENLQQKLDEITALKSIFDDSILTVDETELKGRFLAEPVLNENKLIVCYEIDDRNRNYRQISKSSDKRHSNSVDNRKTEEFCVQHLPPIELYFELSRKYPSKLNPMFLVSCKWLSIQQLELICQKLEDLYFECRMEVLFTWFSFLQTDVLKFLEIEDKLHITDVINQNIERTWSRKSNPASKSERFDFTPRLFRGENRYDSRIAFDMLGTELIQHLKAYNEYKQKETFKKTFFSCNICFSSHSGEDCVVFPCNHINCKKCIRDYFITLIKEGTVHQMKCPETECQTIAPNNLVRELITGDLYERYDRLMLDSLIGSMSDAHYCPRKMCGNLVMADSDSSLAHCNACGHAFCKNCKQTYHGFDPCNMFRDPQQRKEILDEYQNANASEKVKLEKIYGKKQLVSAMEEAATEKWLEDRSKRCPHCKASIEKSDGCNKMSCWRCNTFFCWLCLQSLPLIQPYSHFNNPLSKCFNQLFRGVQFDAEDFFEDQFD